MRHRKIRRCLARRCLWEVLEEAKAVEGTEVVVAGAAGILGKAAAMAAAAKGRATRAGPEADAVKEV